MTWQQGRNISNTESVESVRACVLVMSMNNHSDLVQVIL